MDGEAIMFLRIRRNKEAGLHTAREELCHLGANANALVRACPAGVALT